MCECVCVWVAHTELVPVLLFYLQANFALKTCSSVYISYNSTCGINAKLYNKKPDACVPMRIANYFSTKKCHVLNYLSIARTTSAQKSVTTYFRMICIHFT